MMNKTGFLILISLLLATVSYAVVIDEIVATVNGEPVMLSELEMILKPVYVRYKKTYVGDELEQYKAHARRELLEQLIENKLILQYAKVQGVSITEAALEEQMAEVKEKFGSLEEFEKALEREGLSLKKYKEDLEKQLTIRAMIEREVVPRARVSPQELENFYKKHEDEIKVPLSEVWSELEDKLFKIKLTKEHVKWINSLKSKAHIKITE